LAKYSTGLPDRNHPEYFVHSADFEALLYISLLSQGIDAKFELNKSEKQNKGRQKIYGFWLYLSFFLIDSLCFLIYSNWL